MRALANRQQDLAETIGLLPGTLNATNDALGPLQASFAPTQRFAAEILPGVRQPGRRSPRGCRGWRRRRRSFSKAELGGLLRPDAGGAGDRHDRRLAQAVAARIRSARGVLHAHDHPDRERANPRPAGHDRIAGLPGAVPVGGRDRLGVAELRRQRALHALDERRRGDRVETAPAKINGPLYGNAVLPPLGTRPALAGTAPPLNRTALCGRQSVPKLNSATTGAGREARDPHPPPGLRGDRGADRRSRSWSPATCSSISRRSRSARATTRSTPSSPRHRRSPSGQGQAVTIAGVQVGKVGRRQAARGRAVVQMNIDKQYAPGCIATRPCCCARARR